MNEILRSDITAVVERVLAEDVGSGDLTAGLVGAAATIRGSIVTRESMTLAGRPWVDAVFAALDASIELAWSHEDGDDVAADTVLCRIAGPAAAILTGERAALNLLQTLSATATVTRAFVRAIDGTACRILDTRKTIPGLRLAQKYAVRCGGGTNHRIGLYDAILIKENHIAAAGGIAAAMARCREHSPGLPVEIEVESLGELDAALNAGPERVLLDNFSLDELRAAVARCAQAGSDRPELEASGNVTLDTVRAIAETGVDYVSVGALTKHVRAVDLSMRFDPIVESG